MSVSNRRARLPALLALLCVALPLQATTVRPLNIVDLIDHSETIVAGRVEQVTDGFTPAGMPFTEVTIRVVDRFRGAEGETYTFRQFGLAGPAPCQTARSISAAGPKAGRSGTSARRACCSSTRKRA